MKNLIFLLAIGFVSSVSFGSKVDISPQGNEVTVPGVVSVSVSWVKDKGKKFDLGFQFRNEHQSDIIIQLKEAHCYRGKLLGELKDDKMMALRSGQVKNQTLTCVSSDRSGDYAVTFGKVYENPSGDGNTLGKVLAKEIKWQVSLAQ